MAKLLVTADIHGSLSAWKRILKQLEPGDTLAVAGDLFDTNYGDRSSPDFKPDLIRRDLTRLSRESMTTHVVYGNCDAEDYLEDFQPQIQFEFQGISYCLSHGHLFLPELTDVHVVIEGHSHTPRLDTLFGMIFLNPGSPSRPRNSAPGFAVVEDGVIRLMELSKDKVLARLSIADSLALYNNPFT